MQTPTQSPQPMTAAERDIHIQSLSDHFMAAYQRFEDSGLAADRDEALLERLADEGNDYFQTAGVADARAMRQEPVHG
ncbi:MAG: hypothetical protein V4730_11885 [Pseudomonadota bacterium]